MPNMFRSYFSLVIRYLTNCHCIKNVRIWKFSGPCLPAFGQNTERYRIRTRKTPNMDTFHAVCNAITQRVFRNIQKIAIDHLSEPFHNRIIPFSTPSQNRFCILSFDVSVVAELLYILWNFSGIMRLLDTSFEATLRAITNTNRKPTYPELISWQKTGTVDLLYHIRIVLVWICWRVKVKLLKISCPFYYVIKTLTSKPVL